jgi:hypothetical protein
MLDARSSKKPSRVSLGEVLEDRSCDFWTPVRFRR